jgi:hypothetical protein
MPETTATTKPDVTRIIAWSVFLPILSIWPFVSAMPLFTLFGGDLSTLAFSINIILLLSGFWPLAAAYAGYAFLRIGMPTDQRAPAGQRGLLLGGYATVWTGLYLIVAVAQP